MKHNPPLVSIITPCYNGEEFLHFYFASILAQTWPNLELYFVDDGSTDRTAQVAESYRPALEERGISFFYIYGENKGAAAAINRALDKVKGDYLIWPDSDDMLEPESIELRVHFLEEHHEYGLVRSNRYYIDHKTRQPCHIPAFCQEDHNEHIFWSLINSATFVCSGCYMVRCRLFFSLYPQRQIYETPVGQNWQMLLPMAYFYKCGYIPKRLDIISERSGSHSRINRSKDGEYQRLLGFEQLLKEITVVCGIKDRVSFRKLAVRNARQKRQFAEKYRDTNLFFSQYITLMKNGDFTRQDAKILLKHCFPIAYRWWWSVKNFPSGGLLQHSAIYFCGVFYRLFRRNTWVISEARQEARDNGYWLFAYIRKNHPAQKVVYAIDPGSPDEKKVATLGKVIPYGGFLHKLFDLAAAKTISSQIIPQIPPYLDQLPWDLGRAQRVFLQHGVMLNDAEYTKYKPHYPIKNNINIFITSTPRESNYVASHLGYPPNAIHLTGLCRYDGLLDFRSNPKQILVAPTWRRWIAHAAVGKNLPEDVREFTGTQFFCQWHEFLSHERTLALLEHTDREILFFLHRGMRPFTKYFPSPHPRIKIGDWTQIDIQTALKESAMLITDYSSISVDFAYMQKPLIYYQFDEAMYRQAQYKEGWFSYRKDGFGPVCSNLDSLHEAMAAIMENDAMAMDKVYLERSHNFFPYRDQENCRRNYEAICGGGK